MRHLVSRIHPNGCSVVLGEDGGDGDRWAVTMDEDDEKVWVEGERNKDKADGTKGLRAPVA